MTRAWLNLVLLLFVAIAAAKAHGQQQEPVGWEILPLRGEGGVEYDFRTGMARATNGVLVKYGPAVLTAESVLVNLETGDVVADGDVRIQRDALVWVSEHVRYNFHTFKIEAEQFRTGTTPVFARGEGLRADVTNRVYTATNALITADDIARPSLVVRASQVKIYPNDRIEARNAVLYAAGVPVFWFPYYSRSLRAEAMRFEFMPGWRTAFGPFLLGSYNWYLSEELQAKLHLDYRIRRGIGTGPDLNYTFGPWGQGSLRYYYLYDQDPDVDSRGADIPENRHRIYFSYLANPVTNFSARAMVRYQGDTNIVREFFESEYRQNPQPSTFLETEKFWDNFGLNLYAQPRVNDFLETVERLPEVRLTGYRQQVLGLPVYYESQSSAGYYRRLFPDIESSLANTNYEAARADTYHQLSAPHAFFGWLNVIPRVGARYTYYAEASGPGSFSDEESRGVFNTGAEVNFKASRLWPGVRNRTFGVDGIRHILEPSANYVFIPRPNVRPAELPQFDTELPSLRLLPIEFPEYNAIDSIDSQNALRLGIRNRFQTRRKGEIVNLADWSVYTDWRLDPREDQTDFSDVFSDLILHPTSWLRLESLTRYDTDGGEWRMSYNTLTLQPNDTWSWSVGHYYLRDDFSGAPTALGEGNDLLTSTLYYRVNENWGFRASQRYDVLNGFMQEQAYTIYRDLRSWTAALTLRLRDNSTGPNDVTVAFTFSLKAFPRYGIGHDVVRPYTLWGY